MRWLYLLRHAKSSWDDPGLADIERPLAPRGRRAAPIMGAYMQEHGLVPELTLCSSARRARETFGLLVAAFDRDLPVRFLRELYTATPSDLLDQIRGVSDGVHRLLLVGHNPAMERLAAALARDGDRTAIERLRRKYPTAALAVLALDADRWADATEGGRLERFVRPADLA